MDLTMICHLKLASVKVILIEIKVSFQLLEEGEQRIKYLIKCQVEGWQRKCKWNKLKDA